MSARSLQRSIQSWEESRPTLAAECFQVPPETIWDAFMSLTDVLAIVGALTGITGAALGVISFMRDRARIVVMVHYSSIPMKYEYERFVVIYVVNAGRQPIAVLSVGLRDWAWPTVRQSIVAAFRQWIRIPLITRQHRRLAVPVHSALSSEDEPIVLQPGELRRFFLKAVDPVTADYWKSDRAAVVTDYRGRQYFGIVPMGTTSASHWVPVATLPKPMQSLDDDNDTQDKVDSGPRANGDPGDASNADLARDSAERGNGPACL